MNYLSKVKLPKKLQQKFMFLLLFTNAKDNIYDAPAGTYRAWAEGFFVFLEPMQNGKHTVSLSASVLNPVQPQYNYNAKWTYHLIIGP